MSYLSFVNVLIVLSTHFTSLLAVLIWPLSLLCSGGVTSAAHPVPDCAPETAGLRPELPSARPLETSDRQTGLRSQTHLPCESELLYDSQTISLSHPCLSPHPPQHRFWANSIHIFPVMNIQILIHSKLTSISLNTQFIYTLFGSSYLPQTNFSTLLSVEVLLAQRCIQVCVPRGNTNMLTHTHIHTHVNTPHANTTIL